jgi:acetylornithine/N-succinyldiaminopimelate aminotransferase
MLKKTRDAEDYIREQLSGVQGIKSVRGAGLLLGIEFEEKASPIHAVLLEKRIITGTSSEPNVLRLLPPMCLERPEIDLFITELKGILAQ